MITLALGIAAGLFATAVMDAVNEVLVRARLVLAIDHRMIGRVVGSWATGRFAHRSPAAVPAYTLERPLGHAIHYGIGAAFGAAFVAGWRPVGGAGLVSAIGYGVLTTAAAYLLLFPSMGLGLCGRRSPAGWRLPLSSLVNHAVYGGGLGVGVALVDWLGRAPLAG